MTHLKFTLSEGGGKGRGRKGRRSFEGPDRGEYSSGPTVKWPKTRFLGCAHRQFPSRVRPCLTLPLRRYPTDTLAYRGIALS